MGLSEVVLCHKSKSFIILLAVRISPLHGDIKSGKHGAKKNSFFSVECCGVSILIIYERLPLFRWWVFFIMLSKTDISFTSSSGSSTLGSSKVDLKLRRHDRHRQVIIASGNEGILIS